MANVYPPDFTSDVGKLRVLIGDLYQRVDPATPTVPGDYLFSDEELAALVAINPMHIKFAAANAMDIIASNEALVSKKIRTEDLQTDGPAVANAVREHAKALRSEARDEVMRSDSADAFEVVDFEPVPESWTSPWVAPLSYGYMYPNNDPYWRD